MKDFRKRLPIAVLGLALTATVPISRVAASDFGGGNGWSAPFAPAQVYVVHGIPGNDLGLDPTLPVDVLVNDALCVLQGFTFGQIEGPLPLDEGTYNLKISLANELEPCANAAVLEADLPFLAGESASVVAYLDESGAPTAGKFVNQLSRTGYLKSRLIAQHSAAAPTADVKITRPRVPFARPVMITDFSNGEQATADIVAGKVRVSIAPAGSMSPVFGPVELELRPHRAYLVYAVGSVQTGSFTVLVKEVMTGVRPSGDDDDEDDDDRRGWNRGGGFGKRW
jgi:hypothetical protein